MQETNFADQTYKRVTFTYVQLVCHVPYVCSQLTAVLYLVVIYVQELIDDGARLPFHLLLGQGWLGWNHGWRSLCLHCWRTHTQAEALTEQVWTV